MPRIQIGGKPECRWPGLSQSLTLAFQPEDIEVKIGLLTMDNDINVPDGCQKDWTRLESWWLTGLHVQEWLYWEE